MLGYCPNSVIGLLVEFQHESRSIVLFTFTNKRNVKQWWYVWELCLFIGEARDFFAGGVKRGKDISAIFCAIHTITVTDTIHV